MVSIFIRTYHADIKWLNYCLKSIHKNLTGWDEIVICIPENQKYLLAHLTAEKVVTCRPYEDDYIGQQISKMYAHKCCKNEYILFVDSDVMFYPGADVSDYFLRGKPVILFDKYENVGDAICWKAVTEKFFGEPVEYEYMRRAPQLFAKSTLEKFESQFPDIGSYAVAQPYRQFSEFNILGHFVNLYSDEEYEFIDAKTSLRLLPPNRSKQYWSWSGMTEQEFKELEQI